MRGRTIVPRQGVFGGVIVTLLAEGIAVPAGLITAALLTRDLGPGVYGRFIVVASSVALAEWLLIAVFARATVKFVAEADDWRPVAATAFRAYMGLGLLAGAAFWVLAEPIAALLGDPPLAAYFRMFAPQVPIFAAGASCRNVLSGRGLYRQQAAVSAAGWLGRVVFIVLFLSLGWGIHGAIAGSICGTLAGAAVALAQVRGAVLGAAGLPIRQLMQLALPAFLAMLSGRVSDQLGLLIVQALAAGQEQVGFYGAAMNVMMLTTVIAAASSPVLISSLSAARFEGDSEGERTIGRSALRLGIVLFAFAAVAAACADELVAFLFGADFGPAAPLLALLVFAAVARANMAVVSAMLIAVGRAWTAVAVTMPLLPVAFAGHLVLVRSMGALGAAWVAASSTMGFALAGLLVAAGSMGVALPFGTLARTILLGGAAWLLAPLWPTTGALVLVKVSLLSALVAVGFLATGEVGRDELDRLRSSAQLQRP